MLCTYVCVLYLTLTANPELTLRLGNTPLLDVSKRKGPSGRMRGAPRRMRGLPARIRGIPPTKKQNAAQLLVEGNKEATGRQSDARSVTSLSYRDSG